jgi:hypothetical protein
MALSSSTPLGDMAGGKHPAIDRATGRAVATPKL